MTLGNRLVAGGISGIVKSLKVMFDSSQSDVGPLILRVVVVCLVLGLANAALFDLLRRAGLIGEKSKSVQEIKGIGAYILLASIAEIAILGFIVGKTE